MGQQPSPSSRTPNVRQATLAVLRELGVTTIFGNPGSTELPLFKDFPEDFRYVLGLQESVVLGMADGFAQATRNAAFVNLHSSAGTGHALGNLFTAWRNQTPLVVTAGQQARSILPFEPFLFAERPTEFPQPFVKWAVEPARAEDVPLAIARAYRIAMTPPCGPCFVSVPIDDWDRPCEPMPAQRLIGRNPGDREALRTIAAQAAGASRPVLVCNAGVSRDRAWEGVVALAERLGAAVFTSPHASRNPFPEDHPQFQGFLPPSREGIVATLGEADFVLSLGGPLHVYHVEGRGPHLPDRVTMWSISDNPEQLSWAPAGNAVVANTADAVAQLLAELPDAKAAWMPARETPAAPAAAVLTDAVLMARLAALRPEGSVVVEEAPSSRGAMQRHLRFTRPDSFYATASGGLGFAMPAAVGMALGRPGEKVIALVGDGSSMYGIQALHAAAELGLAITFVIVNNGRYEALHNFGRVFGMQQVVGTDLSGLDFVALAQGHGVPGRRVDSVADLDAALGEAFAADGPTLVEVLIA